MSRLLLLTLVAASTLHAQPEGLWEGYDGEWGHVSRQLVGLADAIPADKFSWRPNSSVRSVSEVCMHLVLANYGLVGLTGPKMPAELKGDMEKSLTDKAQVVSWLKRSLDLVKAERAKLKADDFARSLKVANRTATVDGIYLRIIVHANEHMGQLIAYARTMGVTPPWSKTGGE